ncbi:unnamed protein product [Brassica napus]|uniref:(rape) hypothetical protein n=1 Tax=Brassica napus TaxID=3708 RepID=A0A816ZZ74_BRANA|nr:unnamed protein product [Brassica napus]
MPVASLEVPSPEESENVWSLIPQLKRKLHMHQKKAFEFLWRNLAGSVVPSMMDPSSDKIGGCVVSHTPGAGKHFSSYLFSRKLLEDIPWEEAFGSCSQNNTVHMVQEVHQMGDSSSRSLDP